MGAGRRGGGRDGERKKEGRENERGGRMEKEREMEERMRGGGEWGKNVSRKRE